MTNMHHIKAVDFIGIGAQRSGSTWIAEALREHPSVCFPNDDRRQPLESYSTLPNKELNFFLHANRPKLDDAGESNFDKGLGWYLNQFHPADFKKKCGEFSPRYLHHPESSALIRQAFPDVKLIVTLRNPAEMVYSLYWLRQNSVSDGFEGDFEAALDAGYFWEIGLYHRHLKRYFDVFGRERIFVTTLDEIKSEPETVLKSLYEFCGIDPYFRPTVMHRKVNAALRTKSSLLKKTASRLLGGMKRLGLSSLTSRIKGSQVLYSAYRRANVRSGSYPPLGDETRRRLNEFYNLDLRELELLLKKDFSQWSKP